MRFITENLNKVFKTDIIVNLSAFILIIFVFINFTHNSSDPHRFKLIENNTYLKVDGYEFKKNMNDYLAADSTYAHALDKNCEVTGNMHDRHKVRWVKELFLKHFFKFFQSVDPFLPYYANILLHSFFIFFNFNIS